MRAKVWRLPDGPINSPHIDIVILGFIKTNTHYDKDYDGTNKEYVPPRCYAKGWKPHEQLIPCHPSPIHPTCDGCPLMEFNFGKGGKARGCKNDIKLALFVVGAQDETMLTFNVNRWSLKPMEEYLDGLISQRCPPSRVITRLSFNNRYDFPVLAMPELIALNPEAERHRSYRDEVIELLTEDPDFRWDEGK